MKVVLRDDYQVPAVEAVRALLAYEPETGALRWRVSRGKARAGQVAGVLEGRGYVVLGLLGKRYYAHRIAFLLMTGEWPELVDHINGDRKDNRWSNLRNADNALNQQNQRTASRNNRLGVLGVRAFGGKFRSAICVDGKPKHLGTFATPEEASAAYVAAKRQLHEGCTL